LADKPRIILRAENTTRRRHSGIHHTGFDSQIGQHPMSGGYSTVDVYILALKRFHNLDDCALKPNAFAALAEARAQ
jgi:hypothetical protein